MTAASLLAFDTATERMSIALVTPRGVRLHDSDGGARASATLIPALLALLALHGIALRQLDAIAFGRGPGAFTGLRTTCAVAQGLAFGANLPVLAIDSLAIVAEDARAQGAGDDVWVAMDARMGEVYAAHYRCASDSDGMRWRTLAAPALYALEAIVAQWRQAPPRCVAGSALAAFGARLLDDGAAAQRVAAECSRAQALATLALAAWRDGPRLDAADALPLYLRDKVASTTAEREAVKRAKAAGDTTTPLPR